MKTFRWLFLLVIVFFLAACLQDDKSLSKGMACQLKGELVTTKGIELDVNSCVSYDGYTFKEVQQACAADVQKWQEFSANKKKFKLESQHPESCPPATAKCVSIEEIDVDLKVKKRRILFHYDNKGSELEARKKGCEARRGEFSLISTI